MTTIAMTALFALILVVPYRWRGLTVLFVSSWAIGIGAFTITAKWHRLSDTIGAMAIALLCASLASWWLTARGRVTRYTGRSFPGRVVLVVLITSGAAVTLLIGSALWVAGALRGIDFAVHDDIWEYNAYLGANTIAAGAEGLMLLLFWGLWHRLEVAPRHGAEDPSDPAGFTSPSERAVPVRRVSDASIAEGEVEDVEQSPTRAPHVD